MVSVGDYKTFVSLRADRHMLSDLALEDVLHRLVLGRHLQLLCSYLDYFLGKYDAFNLI